MRTKEVDFKKEFSEWAKEHKISMAEYFVCAVLDGVYDDDDESGHRDRLISWENGVFRMEMRDSLILRDLIVTSDNLREWLYDYPLKFFAELKLGDEREIEKAEIKLLVDGFRKVLDDYNDFHQDYFNGHGIDVPRYNLLETDDSQIYEIVLAKSEQEALRTAVIEVIKTDESMCRALNKGLDKSVDPLTYTIGPYQPILRLVKCEDKDDTYQYHIFNRKAESFFPIQTIPASSVRYLQMFFPNAKRNFEVIDGQIIMKDTSEDEDFSIEPVMENASSDDDDYEYELRHGYYDRDDDDDDDEELWDADIPDEERITNPPVDEIFESFKKKKY